MNMVNLIKSIETADSDSLLIVRLTTKKKIDQRNPQTQHTTTRKEGDS